MKFFGFAALAFAMVASEAEPVVGSLVFHTTDCPDPNPSIGQRIKITPFQIEKPENLKDIKSVYWVYPSAFFRVEFYEDRKSKTPYATIIGTQEGFGGNICKGFTPQLQVEVTASDEAKKAEGLFLTSESYYKVTRIK
jgi:hypothetical protein